MLNKNQSAPEDAQILATVTTPATVATEPGQPTAVKTDGVVTGNCELYLSSPLWDQFQQRFRIHFAELRSGILAPHPIIAPISEGLRKTLKPFVEQHPILNLQNPAGKNVWFDFKAFYEDAITFNGSVRYYDLAKNSVSFIPSAELTTPYAYHLLADSTLAFTTLERCAAWRFSNHDMPALQSIRKMLTNTVNEDIRTTDIKKLILSSDHPWLEFEFLARIASVYQRLMRLHGFSVLQAREACQLLSVAPNISAQEHLDQTILKHISRAIALEVMQAYHSEPGTAPPVPYRIIARI